MMVVSLVVKKIVDSFQFFIICIIISFKPEIVSLQIASIVALILIWIVTKSFCSDSTRWLTSVLKSGIKNYLPVFFNRKTK